MALDENSSTSNSHCWMFLKLTYKIKHITPMVLYTSDGSQITHLLSSSWVCYADFRHCSANFRHFTLILGVLPAFCANISEAKNRLMLVFTLFECIFYGYVLSLCYTNSDPVKILNKLVTRILTMLLVRQLLPFLMVTRSKSTLKKWSSINCAESFL